MQPHFGSWSLTNWEAHLDFLILLSLQSTITEIQQQMTDHHDRNLKLREENQELAGKLKKFIEQYEVREKVCIYISVQCLQDSTKSARRCVYIESKNECKKKKSIMKFIRGHIYIYQYIEKVLITVQSL